MALNLSVVLRLGFSVLFRRFEDILSGVDHCRQPVSKKTGLDRAGTGDQSKGGRKLSQGSSSKGMK